MDELACVTLLGRSGESEAEFQKRLSTFWTHMLRNHEADYERVYAEASRSETHDERIGRQYMVAVDGLETLTRELALGGIDFLPVYEDEIYSKYEAVSPDWFQIEH